MESSLSKHLFFVVSKNKKRFFCALLQLQIANLLSVSVALLLRLTVFVFDMTTAVEDYPQDFISVSALWAMSYFSNTLLSWTLLLSALSLISAYFKYRMRWNFAYLGRSAEKEMRSKIFEKIQKQTRSFFIEHRVGGLMNRLSNDVSVYAEMLGPGLMFPLLFLTLIIPAFYAMFSISPWMAGISIVPALLLPALIVFTRAAFYRLAKAIHMSLGELSTMAQETFSESKLVKSFQAESFLQHRFDGICSRHFTLAMEQTKLQGIVFPLLSLIGKGTTIALVVVVGIVFWKKLGVVQAADFAGFMWIQSRLLFPVLMLGWVLSLFHRGKAAYDRLREIYLAPLEVNNCEDSKHVAVKRLDIRVKGLCFSYPGADSDVLKEIDLDIRLGSLIGITGPVGSGKSTLLHVLRRDYEFQKGSFFFGEIDIREWNLLELRKRALLLEQSPFLFSRTIRENVRMGGLEAEEEKLMSCVSLAELDETIDSWTDQYDTVIGERGVTLSGGQKQRLALARALLEEREILMLDDSFSSLDSKTEARIFSRLKRHMKDKTCLMVTQRIPLLQKVDKVLFMQEGKIIEQGTHSELMHLSGHYAAMVELAELGNGGVE